MLDRTRSIPEPQPHRGRKQAPPGYERYATVDWASLTNTEIAIVCHFADTLDEIRRNELELLWSGTYGRYRALTAAINEQTIGSAKTCEGEYKGGMPPKSRRP